MNMKINHLPIGTETIKYFTTPRNNHFAIKEVLSITKSDQNQQYVTHPLVVLIKTQKTYKNFSLQH